MHGNFFLDIKIILISSSYLRFAKYWLTLLNSSILFLSPSAYALGGVSEWLDYTLPGLNAAGWRCTLGITKGMHHDVDAYLKRHPWVSTVSISSPTGSEQGRVMALMDVIRRARPQILAVVNIASAYEAVRRLRLLGEPTPKLVTMLHGLQSDLLGDLNAERDVVDAVVAVNRLACVLAGSSLGSPERVYYASCGVAQSGAAVQQRVTARGGVLRLMFCGRIEQHQKRVFDLPELAHNLVTRGVAFQISIAGGGPDEAALRHKIDALGVAHCFQFLGVLNPQELAVAYRNHDALVITSVWETGPIVAWEAMSHGLPVVSSRYVGSGLEGALVHQSNCLLFPVGDMNAAASAVQSLAELGLTERLARGGRELVRSRYSREASVVMWDDAFHRILALPPLPVPAQRPAPAPSGRLDRWLGAAGGERVRRALGVAYRHDGPGGEWPHTGQPHAPQDAFLARAASLDQVST